MIPTHVFNCFTRDDLRPGSAYVFSQFIGGMAAPLFLFLAGITSAFQMDAQDRKQPSPWRRVRAALQRAGYILALAFAFRLSNWIFSLPSARWTDVLRVDILNCMGFSMIVLSVVAAVSTRQRVKLCVLLGLVIAAVSPLVSGIDWSQAPGVVRHYLVPDYNFFSFFPWAAFLVFGISAGSLIRILPDEHMDRAMQWSAILGGALFLACQYFASLLYTLYAKSDFWLNSPAQVLSKLGVILLVLPVAYLWTRYSGNRGWSWIRQFGITSLLVYWVHIELVYGRWLSFCKESLDVTQTAAAATLVILLLLGLSVLRTNRDL